MISALFGSKNAERVLLFLLVNEGGYASQIQRTFQIPLTPLQSILAKLEKAKVLISEKRGKTKYFYFNPSYPLYKELKNLLKTAFVHLLPDDKRILFSRTTSWRSLNMETFEKKKWIAVCLNTFWEKLEQVRSVVIQTETDKQGSGTVTVLRKHSNELIFTERGTWKGGNLNGIDFTKTYRWTIDYSSGFIALEHLHYGQDRPVFLFHLAPQGPNCLQSVESHVCLDDCYFGRIEMNEESIRFQWRILGPKKNEVLFHTYLY